MEILIRDIQILIRGIQLWIAYRNARIKLNEEVEDNI